MQINTACTKCERHVCVAQQFETVYLVSDRWDETLHRIRWGDNRSLAVNNADIRHSLYRIFLLEMEWGSC